MCNVWCKGFVRKTVPQWPVMPAVLEVGARNVNGSVRDILEPLTSRYVGCDLEAGEGVDVVADATRLTDVFPPESFDVLVSTEMLEHVPDWPAAWAQMLTVLRPGGLFILSTRSPGFPLHDYPGDFWRFNARDIGVILEGVADILMVDKDLTLGYPCGIGVLARKRPQIDLQAWQARLSAAVPIYQMQACERMTHQAFAAGISNDGPLAPLREKVLDLEQRLFDAQIAMLDNRQAELELELEATKLRLEGVQAELKRTQTRSLALEATLQAWHASVFGRLSRVANYGLAFLKWPWRAARCLIDPGLREQALNHMARRWRKHGIRRKIGELPGLEWLLGKLQLDLPADQVHHGLERSLTRQDEATYREMIGPLQQMGEGKPSTVIRPSSLVATYPPEHKRKRILFVCGEFPNPLHGGGGRVADFVKALSLQHDIYVAAWYERVRDHKSYTELAPYCRRMLGLSFEDLERGCSDRLFKLIGERPVDVVHYEWPRSLRSFDRRLGRHHIYTHMEAVSCSLWMDLRRLPPLTYEWLKRFTELLIMLKVEILDADKADAQVVVTAKDGAFLSRFAAGREFYVVNHGIDRAEFSRMDCPSDPNTLVFTGNFTHYPNVDAVHYFMRDIYPAIRAAVPEVRVWFVGSNPPDAVRKYEEKDRIMVTGNVEDIRPFIQKATICIAPLVSGAGLRTKVVQYAALRRPSVVTPIAAEDLLFEAGRDLCVADNAEAFANQVITLLRDPDLAATIADRAYERAVREYDNVNIAEHSLNTLYHLLDQQRGQT